MAIIVHSPSGGSHEGTWLLGYIMSWSTGEAGHTKHLKDNALLILWAAWGFDETLTLSLSILKL
eukprot:scaffold19348_cov16-Tisochrysis_lutea.AAC.1